MCGLAGFIANPAGGATASDLETAASKMADTLRPRGPDDAGAWADSAAGLALGHRRLAVIDLSEAGRQPMISSCERWVIHAAVVPPSAGVERTGWKDALVHNYRIIAKLDGRPRLDAFLSTVRCQKDIDRMKRIWQDRKIVLITNPETWNMAVDCGLFCNAKQQNSIETLAAESFDAYKTLLQQAKRHSNDTLFLLACGPTATVLAHDLHLCGYQAVDIGHFVHHLHRCLRRQ